MSWDIFYIFAGISVLFAFAGATCAMFRPASVRIASVLFGTAVAVSVIFIAGLWYSLGRPPMRTMGETRLWYSLTVLLAGFLVYIRWRYRWILLFSAVLSSVFSIINVVRPEIHDQTLVPALQSIWFIPHVTIYMFAYGILACAFILAAAGCLDRRREYFESLDNLVYIGTGLLFLGLLSGAVWAKQAWGDFWEWDPKESWAAVTCAAYLTYIHLRFTKASRSRWLYGVVIAGFLLLQMCWYGYRYLPSSQESVHTYNITN